MSIDDERQAIHRQLDYLADQLDRVQVDRVALISDITSAVRDALPAASMTEDEHRWVKMAIQSEAERAAFRKAVIEKSVVGLVWLAILFIGSVLYTYLKAHGWQD